MSRMQFELKATDGAARRGQLTFPRGTVQTPAFMPVGTYGTVKGILPRDLEATGAEICLGNTFHLMLRPGTGVIQKHGDLHDFMQWQKPIDRNWFTRRWHKADNEGFVVLAQGTLPARSDATTLLQAIEDVRRSSKSPALSYWQVAVARYPDNALMHFAHGNALYQAGNKQAARNAFASAVALQPGLHAGWNNLASVLLELGLHEEATDAITRALELAPTNALYVETRDDILSAP